MPSKKDFPIVGIGASAGGLDAYKSLLDALPADTGAAFILIQHLDPHHPSMMADLLGRHTTMTVVQAENDMALEPDTVYVIPPGKFLRLADHGLFLDEPVKERGIRMSIDHFFRSLAEGRGEKAIGIVLSGTGTDGTLGIREIKAAGGMVMVQKPEEADHDGMPRSAIATGTVDFALPVADMPERIVQFIRHPYLDRSSTAPTSEAAPVAFQEVLRLLRIHTDYDFRSYKTGTIDRRIQRRMGLGQFKELSDYVSHLRDKPEEVHHLFRDLLIGVTRFFREPEAWEVLADRVIGPMLDAKPRTEPIRAWVPGCASGEEAYTLAMVLYDRIDRRRGKNPVQIFATDLNDRAIAAARSGQYSSAAAADVPPEMLHKFFSEAGTAIMVNKRLRETVVFATQNVISDPPFSKLDLITCRNLMIYLDPDVQQRMIEMFHFALSENGHLLLGSSESADRPARLFTPVDKGHRIYRKTVNTRARRGSFPIAPSEPRMAQATDNPPPMTASGAELSRRRLMDRFVPASVLVDREMSVQYFHGPVRKYLDFPVGEPTTQLPDMTLPDLRAKVRAVLNSVLAGKASAETLALNVTRDAQEVNVRIVAERMEPEHGSPSFLVHFRDDTPPRDAEAAEKARAEARETATPQERDAVASLEYELQSTREDLQSTIEEMETSNEELKASNEEVMSMNEELQSTNEELETSREELQSLNEELSTVNSQLEDKIDELEQTNNDLTNLLASIDIGVIFLDTDLMIRRFTPAMKQVMRIIDGDIGRPAEDIAMRVYDPKLIDDARQCLDQLVELEAEISTDSGLHRIRRLRPYRTAENRIQGVVVTYTDVTSLQNARAAARRREGQQTAVAELGRRALSGAGLTEIFDLAVADLAQHLNVRFTKVLELDPDGRHLTLRSGRGWTHATVGESKVDTGTESQAGYTLQRRGPIVVRDFREEKRFRAPPLLAEHHILAGASVIIGPQESPWGVLGVHESDPERCDFDTDDINFLHAVANALWLVIARDAAVARIEAERRQLRDMTDTLPILFSVIDAQERFEFLNDAFAALGVPTEEIKGKRVSDVLDADSYAAASPHIDKVLKGERQRFEVSFRAMDAAEPTTALVTYAPRRNSDGVVDGYYAAILDISEQKRLERDLAERFDQYRTLGESIPYGTWITDAEGTLTYLSQAFLDLVGLDLETMAGDGWLTCLAPGTHEETARLWAETVAAGSNWEREHRVIGADGETYHILALGRPIRDDAGQITSWVGLNLDITERKAEAEHLSVISAELDHRVKNILATVSTIARMTGRSATDLETYRDALQARLRAMAAAHKLLADTGWHGMDLATLVETEVGPYHSAGTNQVTVEGPDVVLSTEKVQTLALAFHEMTTNSVKYGALSTDDGKLDIRWTLDPELSIDWIETGLTGVTPPSTEGFGTTLLTRILAAQGAQVSINFPSTGIRVRIVLPDPT